MRVGVCTQGPLLAGWATSASKYQKKYDGGKNLLDPLSVVETLAQMFNMGLDHGGEAPPVLRW